LTATASLMNRGRALSALAGAALPLAFAPFHLYPLAVLLPAALFALWHGQSPREAAWRGYWFGFAAFATGTYWLYISVHVFGGAPVPVAALLMIAGFCGMAIYVALTGAIVAYLGLGSRVLRWCLVWPAVCVVVEWLRTWLFTGFPWFSIGYSQIDGPLRAWAPVFGVHGVSLVTLMLAGALLTVVRGARAERIGAAAIVVVIVIATATLHERSWTVPTADTVRASLIQGSIEQDRKWLPEQLRPTLELYGALTFAESDVDLIVWPEVAIPSLARHVQSYLDVIDTKAAASGVQIYLGILMLDDASGQYRNSLIGLGAEHAEYHKRHLVPFGEFFPVPDFARRWMRSAGLPNKDTLRGARNQPPLPLNGHSLAPSICYEDVFGSEQLDFLPQASMLINVSNDAWFGDSIAPHQHLQMAQMRSLETGRPMLRATNTGISAIIGADGRIVGRLPQFETDVLRAEVQPRTGATPYVRFGSGPVLIICAVLIGLGGFWRRRRSVVSLPAD
jgi:apolipoprotein N-acyltransferase